MITSCRIFGRAFQKYAALLFICIGSSAAIAADALRPPLKIVMEEFMIPSGDAGIDLYVRNKHPQGVNAFANGKNTALCTRLDLPVGDRVRFAVEWNVVDGLHRQSRLRCLSG